jgi:hypothetical protein
MSDRRLTPQELVEEARSAIRPTSRYRWRGVTEAQLRSAASTVGKTYEQASQQVRERETADQPAAEYQPTASSASRRDEESAEAQPPTRPSATVSPDSAESQALAEIAVARRQLREETNELLAAEKVRAMAAPAHRLRKTAGTARQLLMGPLLTSSFLRLDQSFPSSELRPTDRASFAADMASLAVDVIGATDYLLSLLSVRTPHGLGLASDPWDEESRRLTLQRQLLRQQLEARGAVVELGTRLFAQLSSSLPDGEELRSSLPEGKEGDQLGTRQHPARRGGAG